MWEKPIFEGGVETPCRVECFHERDPRVRDGKTGELNFMAFMVHVHCVCCGHLLTPDIDVDNVSFEEGYAEVCMNTHCPGCGKNINVTVDMTETDTPPITDRIIDPIEARSSRQVTEAERRVRLSSSHRGETK